MRKFDYTEDDHSGEQTLLSIAEAQKFNKWMYDTIKPYCKGRILELGSGTGNITHFFLKDNKLITASDIRENYRQYLSESFSKYDLEVLNINMVHPEFDKVYEDYMNSFDTVFALNVLEHIEDDSSAINNCKKLLKENGLLIILVPSYDILYNKLDYNLMHYRRYNKSILGKIFNDNGLIIKYSQYFNFVGIFAWFLSGKVLKDDHVPSGKMKLYNMLVPLFKIVDKCIFNKIGLSTIVVGEKSNI
jgi:2-polyprenyl-3-methyl-5-hydroxy-6-metoxy-1,4-benzoquinol methylase